MAAHVHVLHAGRHLGGLVAPQAAGRHQGRRARRLRGPGPDVPVGKLDRAGGEEIRERERDREKVRVGGEP